MIRTRLRMAVLLSAALGLTPALADPPVAPSPVASSPSQPAGEHARRYDRLKREIRHRRHELGDRYRLAVSDRERSLVLAEARRYAFETLSHDILPAWFGTNWAFYGVTETPREGSIACGYFVTTVLRDAGFLVARDILAQQPSELMIRNLTSEAGIQRYHDASVHALDEGLRVAGPGLYVVGLDRHTGFILYDGSAARFVHSSYYNPPRAVVSEPLRGNNPLAHSRYRVVGKLFEDDMMRRWLLLEEMPVRYR